MWMSCGSCPVSHIALVSAQYYQCGRFTDVIKSEPIFYIVCIALLQLCNAILVIEL